MSASQIFSSEDINPSHHPKLNKKTHEYIEKMKSDGKWGQSALDHMKMDLESRKDKQQKRYIIEVKADKK